MAEGNYIKLNRSLLEWEWYQDIKTCRVFIHMLLKANWKEGNFKGVDIPRGSFVSSLNNMACETNLTVDEVRTSIKHLKRTNEIATKSHSKFTVFTVVKYDAYQDNPTQLTKQVPSKSQASPKQIPTIEECKKGIREEGKKKNRAVFTAPTVEEVKTYCQEGNRKIDAERFVDFYTSKNWMVGRNKMKDWKAAVRNWERGQKERTTDDKKKNKFQNFNQRTYDYDSMERKLLGVTK